MKILVADDEVHARSALRLILQHKVKPTRIQEARSLKEAAKLTEVEPPDLVLLDWELSKAGGGEALKTLRAFNTNLPVIALSARPEAYADALQAGVVAFVSKGAPPEQLLSAVEMFNKRSKQEAEL